jgi:hypothetical protein
MENLNETIMKSEKSIKTYGADELAELDDTLTKMQSEPSVRTVNLTARQVIAARIADINKIREQGYTFEDVQARFAAIGFEINVNTLKAYVAAANKAAAPTKAKRKAKSKTTVQSVPVDTAVNTSVTSNPNHKLERNIVGMHEERTPCPKCGDLDHQMTATNDNTIVFCQMCGHHYIDSGE